jgi:hypothetical protein
MPWDAPAALSDYQSSVGSINNTLIFIAMVEAIVSDTNDATDEEKFDALKGFLEATDKVATIKKQEMMLWQPNTRVSFANCADAKGDNGSSDSMKGFCTIS